MTDKLRTAILNYMSQFGQALEAHEIPFTETQIQADKTLREALQAEPVGCVNCAEVYQVVGCLRDKINYDALEPVLDNLSASAQGLPAPHTLLPFTTLPSVDALIAEIDGVGEALAYDEDGDCYRSGAYSKPSIDTILDKYRSKV